MKPQRVAGHTLAPRPDGGDNELLLLRAHGAAHKRDHVLSPSLPEITAAKKSFHHDEAFARVLPGTVQIEEDQGLMKAGWQLILGPAGGSAARRAAVLAGESPAGAIPRLAP
jgi:hypothetical protein